jgi:hypothetical protein
MREDPDGHWWFLIPIVSGLIVWANAVISAPDFPMDVATISEDLSAGDKVALGIDLACAAVPALPASGSKIVKKTKQLLNAGGEIPWTSGTVSHAAKQLMNGAESVAVKTKSQAEELFLGLYQGKGYKNVSGMKPSDSMNLLGTKYNTYHWDPPHGPKSQHNAPHLQIHDAIGRIVRIFYEN